MKDYPKLHLDIKLSKGTAFSLLFFMQLNRIV